jgi:glycosyltransferase involved in cell wall biosynthesis
MESDIFFSIIIPTFNRADKLKRALNSLVDQSYANFEVIVCDDGSTDNTKEVVSYYQNSLNITYLYDENWGGPARPRNLGIGVAKGDWIGFLDADDWWYENKLEEVSKLTMDFDFIYHKLDRYFEADSKIIGEIKSAKLGNNAIYTIMKLQNPLATSSVVVRKELIINAGLFDEEKELIASEDFNLWLKIAMQNPRFHLLNKTLGAYSVGDDNISSDRKKAYKRNVRIINRYADHLSGKQKNQVLALLEYNLNADGIHLGVFQHLPLHYKMKYLAKYFLKVAKLRTE